MSNHTICTRALTLACIFGCSTTVAQAQNYGNPNNGLNNSGIVQQLMQQPQPAPTGVRQPTQLGRAGGLPPFPQQSQQSQQLGAVRQASFEDTLSQANWPAVAPQQQPVQQPTGGQSFLERETTEQGSANDRQQLFMKIAINLAFVMVLAVGAIFAVRQWFKGRPASGKSNDENLLNVSQVLRLGNGVALHVVEGPQNKFLVAIDSGGVKSVNVLTSSFEENMTLAEARELAGEGHSNDKASEILRSKEREMRELVAKEYELFDKMGRDVAPKSSGGARSTITSRRVRVRPAPETSTIEMAEFDESTQEIDEKLIALLLQRSKEAA